MEAKELKEGEEFHCIACKAVISVVADIQNEQPLKKGNLVICGHCAALHKIGDADLVPFTKQDFAALDQQSKDLILKTVQSVLAKKARDQN